jgi:hypothetical protein
MALAPVVGHASVIGFLGNFDVINDTGSTAHGFEIELEGLHAGDISDTFGGVGRGFPSGRGFDPAQAVQRYGAPEISEYSDGVTFGARVSYRALWDGVNWDYGTPSGTFITPGDNCWTGGGVGYGAGTPCDHFGVGTTKTPTNTKYSWLLETPAEGVLTNGTVNLPAPVIGIIPPADPVIQPQPVVGAAVVAPRNEQDAAQFGDAIWVKVFTTELEDVVELEELVGGNQKVEQAETEIEWQLLQYDPGNPDSPPSMLESGYGAPVGPNAASILRRYEFYAFSGDYKEEDHEAILAFSDSHPNCIDDPACLYDPNMPVELGHYLGAQNVAANLIEAPRPVPLPATLALFASALAPLAIRRRRVS